MSEAPSKAPSASQPPPGASQAPGATGRHQRRLGNYLLDRHFQLKYTSYLVGIAILLSASLGAVLFVTSEKLIEQSQEGVRQGDQVARLGGEVVKESKKVSDVVEMNIVKDPVYGDNPELLEAFKGSASEKHAELTKKQTELTSQASALRGQFERLAEQQKTMRYTIFSVLLALVVFIGLAGIVITHKVAGPIYKMKRQLREVGAGSLRIPGKLRKGDELVDFFDAFADMVSSLRRRQEREVELLDAAIEKLQATASAEHLGPVREVRDEMHRALGPAN